MWRLKLILTLAASITTANISKNTTLLKEEQIIFASEYNISKILIPADLIYIHADTDAIPAVFFTIVDPKSEMETSIYVLKDFAAYEVLDGGRDSTSDYSFDKSVYFGAKDGLYKYDPSSKSAKKFGIVNDDIKQLQKVNGSDAFYMLTKENQLFIVEDNGRVKKHVYKVQCATEFVLDTSNNLYFVSCVSNIINILKPGDTTSLAITDDFRDVKLLRPAFIMERSIPAFLDGTLYLLHVNGLVEKKEFHIDEELTALSVDSAVYLVAGFNGKLFEFNVIDSLLSSMFINKMKDMSQILTSIIEINDDDIYKWVRK